MFLNTVHWNSSTTTTINLISPARKHNRVTLFSVKLPCYSWGVLLNNNWPTWVTSNIIIKVSYYSSGCDYPAHAAPVHRSCQIMHDLILWPKLVETMRFSAHIYHKPNTRNSVLLLRCFLVQTLAAQTCFLKSTLHVVG